MKEAKEAREGGYADAQMANVETPNLAKKYAQQQSGEKPHQAPPAHPVEEKQAEPMLIRTTENTKNHIVDQTQKMTSEEKENTKLWAHANDDSYAAINHKVEIGEIQT
mmetsp:Transcript_15217/g.23503  ORF Transcript_15217/g.23503 Transcript_15217/m.23503 type:complete len:108 (+) Transcript_15217:220-543(+)